MLTPDERLAPPMSVVLVVDRDALVYPDNLVTLSIRGVATPIVVVRPLVIVLLVLVVVVAVVVAVLPVSKPLLVLVVRVFVSVSVISGPLTRYL